MHSFEPREHHFYPTASTLVAGDTIVNLSGVRVEGTLSVLAVEKNPAQVRVMLQDETGKDFWVTLLPTHEVSLKPPF